MTAQQQSLQLLHHDGQVIYIPRFLDLKEADQLFDRLQTQIQWRGETYKMFGKTVTAPRLLAWYGEPGARYCYSGVCHNPLPWTIDLKQLCDRLSEYCQNTYQEKAFNSVLANLYRDGRDSMGWHADQEPELGLNPCIASISLGEQRLFKLRHNNGKQQVRQELENGSLLIMRGTLQHHWQHCVPKTSKPRSVRINLTFRSVSLAL